VLKLSLPHREAQHEAAALEHWRGAGAARLYRHDPDRWALLIERCEPGVPLLSAANSDEEKLDHAAAVLRRLWSTPLREATPIQSLAEVTSEWATLLRNRMSKLRPPIDAGLVELGAQLLERLPSDDAAKNVVLHGDFNPGNVLSSQRAPWLAIDPKPMVGDAAFDPIPMLGQIGDLYDPGSDEALLRYRHERFADLVEISLERLLGWAVARMVEWSLWYVSREELKPASESMTTARRLADLADL
jgi:streptomycin 6-kinase